MSRSPLASLFGAILTRKWTGTLSVVHRGETRHFFFEVGNLRTASSDQPELRLGAFLARRGWIARADLDGILRGRAARAHKRLGRVLVESGLLSAEVLDAEMKELVDELVFPAFAWTSGDFLFRPSDQRLDPDLALDVSTPEIVLEGIRRLPPSEQFVELLGDLGGRPAASDEAGSAGSRVVLAPDEAYLLSQCDGKTSMADLLRLGGDRQGSARTLYALLVSGLAEIPAERGGEPFLAPVLDPISVPLLPREARKIAANSDTVRLEMAREHYLHARKLLMRKDFYGAIQLLEQAARLSPASAEYRLRLAGALARNPHWRERAQEQYSEALRLNPNRREILLEYAQFLARSGRKEQALELAHRLVERFPDVAEHENLLARLEGRAGAEGSVSDPAAAPEDGAEEPEARSSILSRLFRRD